MNACHVRVIRMYAYHIHRMRDVLHEGGIPKASLCDFGSERVM
jgi:hypothetical protein